MGSIPKRSNVRSAIAMRGRSAARAWTDETARRHHGSERGAPDPRVFGLGLVISRSAFEPMLALVHEDPGFDFDQSLVEDRFSNESP